MVVKGRREVLDGVPAYVTLSVAGVEPAVGDVTIVVEPEVGDVINGVDPALDDVTGVVEAPPAAVMVGMY